MSSLLERFIQTFQKAIATEMEVMRQRLGPFEAPLGQGRRLEPGDEASGKRYAFKVLQANDKLVPQLECTLKSEAGESLVTVLELQQDEVILRSERTLSLNEDRYTLVIYPWFLYEKLLSALALLLKDETFFVGNALRLFGQGDLPQRRPQPLKGDHEALNDSQLRAVQLCSDSNLAFIWGPPGTGKTTTLGHIITELLSQGQRLLLTSTTNAAVDQALAQLAGLPEAQPYFERGQIVRLGQAGVETFGTTLRQVVERLNAERQTHLEALRHRQRRAGEKLKQCDLLLDKLKPRVQGFQLDLFSQLETPEITWLDLNPIFSTKLVQRLLALPPARQAEAVARRRQRLLKVGELCQQQIEDLRQALRQQEGTVAQQARLVLATMTTVYLSSLLQGERFDTVIVEEAGMAILPTLFYNASLARTKVIVVGDPQQLPPVVQARDEYVYRAMGRNIFEVAGQKSLTVETTVMLDLQYRMHPIIGDLVSRLFYQGQLRHAENTRQRQGIAQKSPYPAAPLVVIDTAGQTSCVAEPGGFSRLNEKTAQRCVELALEAVQNGIDSVAIITPYVAQSRLIRQQLGRFPKAAAQVECRTVHRFQGGERDLVILDTVDTAPLPPGVLLTDSSPFSSAKNLLNVSLSRARGKLIIVADVAYFKRTAPGSIINEMLAQAIQAGIRMGL